MNVNLYTTSTCPFSEAEKTLLGEKGVLFTEIILDKTPEQLPQFSAVNDGFSGVPLTVVTQSDGSVNIVKGFNTEELVKALHLEENQITLRQDSGQAENKEQIANNMEHQPEADRPLDETTDNSQPASSSNLPNPSDLLLDQQNSASSQDVSQITPPVSQAKALRAGPPATASEALRAGPPPVPTDSEGDGQAMQTAQG